LPDNILKDGGCTCGRSKGPIRIVKVHDKLTLHVCMKCDGEISRWEDGGQKRIVGKPRKLTAKEKKELK
jgi:hypothetical protein